MPAPEQAPIQDNSAQAMDHCRRRKPGRITYRPVPGNPLPPQPPVAPPYSGPCFPEPTLQDYTPPVPVPDRWRIVNSLPGYQWHWWDPYDRNPLKGDRPLWGDDWFFAFTGISDTVFEYRDVPIGVGTQSTRQAAELGTFGATDSKLFQENLIPEFVVYKGDTVFQPPDLEFRFTPVFNYNYNDVEEITALDVRPSQGHTRSDGFVGIQTAYVDVHLRNVSPHYDFDSLRVGIQPFTADFRGFLFLDQPLGIRLFGTRDNNIFQYNLAYFRRVDKDTNSGLNDIYRGVRDDDVYVANLYWQDALFPGHTLEFVILHNRNAETAFFYDDNGFLERPASFAGERPRSYQVTYLGFNTNGHIGRLNLTTATYYAFGTQDHSPFTNRHSDIRAFFAAAEFSVDEDWIRWRLSLLYGSGDSNPYDDKDTGFDAVLEDPLFAGADTSYWIRQAVPLIGGGGVSLSMRNGVLASLRSARPHSQSNFTNPGIILIGLGGDFNILPQFRMSFNANKLYFDHTEVLEALLHQGGIGNDIGWDLSVSSTYRPFMTQNIVLRLSYAALVPGSGYKAMFGSGIQNYVLLNATLTY